MKAKKINIGVRKRRAGQYEVFMFKSPFLVLRGPLFIPQNSMQYRYPNFSAPLKWICLKLRMSYNMHRNYLPFARLQLTRGSSCLLGNWGPDVENLRTYLCTIQSASSPARGTLQTPTRWHPFCQLLNPVPPRGGAQKKSNRLIVKTGPCNRETRRVFVKISIT